ncbi:MAG: hypothetical protein BWY82_02863 [Verrucomicrobia bacterium ADurb.Bin474]|nr:MAG: hypothetical protein BWY82_02863 [Verrucomicrobia bacterium ADurb.Bin474]
MLLKDRGKRIPEPGTGEDHVQRRFECKRMPRIRDFRHSASYDPAIINAPSAIMGKPC